MGKSYLSVGGLFEVLGAARDWEVTGEGYYLDIVKAFWQQAVEKRGFFYTGGQTCGEIWTPPFDFSARLGKNQEHCTIYNMMRLADFLFKLTGDVKYADYWERNLFYLFFGHMEPIPQEKFGDLENQDLFSMIH